MKILVLKLRKGRKLLSMYSQRASVAQKADLIVGFKYPHALQAFHTFIFTGSMEKK